MAVRRLVGADRNGRYDGGRMTMTNIIQPPYHDISAGFPDGSVLTLCGQKIRTDANRMQKLFDESDCTQICLYCESIKADLNNTTARGS